MHIICMRRNIFEKNMHLITNKMTKRAFTLAEILIVLTVIGIITSILLPAAFQSVPDENVMKFKKGNATLAKVISELVSSGEYYTPGDLSLTASGKVLDEETDSNKTHLCNSFADVINTKSVNCSKYANYAFSHISVNWNNKEHADGHTYDSRKSQDEYCKASAKDVGNEIVTSDGIVYYQASPGIPFGIDYFYPSPNNTSIKYQNGERTCGIKIGLYKLPNAENCDEMKTGILRIYKVFCMDIDGIPEGGSDNCDDSKDVCPFGYGLRVDGKIMPGVRALEWIQKGIQDKE